MFIYTHNPSGSGACASSTTAPTSRLGREQIYVYIHICVYIYIYITYR